MMFLAALLLAARGLGDLLMVVTAFAAAHSLTLATAALGWLNLPSQVVEPAIALSIACVAVENLVGVKPPRRWAMTFALGLVHGFGFAGVLVEISLPTGRLVPALFGFNLGVEVGQLVLVAALWPVLRDLARLREGRPHRLLVEVTSAALCSVGMFWFLTRAFA